MNFNHTEDRRMLQDSLGRYVREQYPHDQRMQIAASESGYSTEKYAELCELGIAGALLPESSGGFGGAGYDCAVVFEELGRGLVVEPLLASAVLGGRLLASLDSDNSSELLAEVIEGKKLLAFAHSEADSRYELSRVTTSATQSGGGWTLNGQKTMVLNGDIANHLLVSARTGGAEDEENGISVFLIDANTDGVTVTGYPTVDGFRAASVDLKDVKLDSAALLGVAGAAYESIEAANACGIVALCAEALGAMEVCKETTLEYLQTRK